MEYIWWCASLVGYHWCASLVGYHLHVYICAYIYIIIIIYLYNTSTNAEMYVRGGPPHNQEGFLDTMGVERSTNMRKHYPSKVFGSLYHLLVDHQT